MRLTKETSLYSILLSWPRHSSLWRISQQQSPALIPEGQTLPSVSLSVHHLKGSYGTRGASECRLNILKCHSITLQMCGWIRTYGIHAVKQEVQSPWKYGVRNVFSEFEDSVFEDSDDSVPDTVNAFGGESHPESGCDVRVSCFGTDNLLHFEWDYFLCFLI